MSGHRVVYANGDARVVCSCGETFTTVPQLGLSTGGNVLSGLAQWGRHQSHQWVEPQDAR